MMVIRPSRPGENSGYASQFRESMAMAMAYTAAVLHRGIVQEHTTQGGREARYGQYGSKLVLRIDRRWIHRRRGNNSAGILVVPGALAVASFRV
jgi:hypothetical protein